MFVEWGCTISLNNVASDAENHLLTVNTNSATYDALGRTVEIQTGGQIIDVVYAPDGQKLALMSGQTIRNAFVPLPGGGTAVYDSNGLAYYRHPDWLGSSRLASKPDRGVYSETAYAPFGEPYAQSGTTDLSFTGQTQDTNAGLYDFLYRRYSPVQGRWLSPDPAGLAAVDPANPQSWNRYAYVGNAPEVFIDPVGLFQVRVELCDDVNGCTGGYDDGGGNCVGDGMVIDCHLFQNAKAMSAGLECDGPCTGVTTTGKPVQLIGKDVWCVVGTARCATPFALEDEDRKDKKIPWLLGYGHVSLNRNSWWVMGPPKRRRTN